MRKRIAIIGAAEAREEERAAAHALGRFVAETGAVLLTGGRGGVMAEASRGAHEAGGLVVAILPGSAPDPANPWVDVPIVTNMGSGRNVINVMSADLVIAVGGGFGTLSEIGLALKHGVPVISFSGWELHRAGADLTGFEPTTDLEETISIARRILGT